MYIGAKDGMDADALDTLQAIGADILRKPIITSCGDIRQMQQFSHPLFQISAKAAEAKYDLDVPETGSVEESIVQTLDIEHPLVFNALLEQVSREV